MIKHKKRSKRTRLRGSRTAYWGNRKKHKGTGMRGGAGMAGTGKKAGQKKTFIQRYFPDYFGKEGMKAGKKLDVINLDYINQNLAGLFEKGIAKKTGKGIELDLQGYKILGDGELKEKLIIKADAASQQAKEKVEKTGGEVILKYSKVKEEKKDKKEENAGKEKTWK